jgi:hypothetical protein
LQNLGQDLFAPPNVKGWDGGLSWITTNHLLARYNYSEMLVFGTAKLNFAGKGKGNQGLKIIEHRFNRMNSQGKPVPVQQLFIPAERQDQSLLLAALQKRLLQGRLKPQQEQVLKDYLKSQSELDDHDILETIRLVMSTPEYQIT